MILKQRGCLVIIVFILAPFFLVSESEGFKAALLSGPESRRGVPLRPLNGIPYTYGQYRWGDITIELFFNRYDQSYPGDWTVYQCANRDWLKLEHNNYFYVYGVSVDPDNPWSLLMRFSSLPENPCLFLAPFIERFEYFEKLVKDKNYVSFPATLEE